MELLRYLLGVPGPSGFGSNSTGEEVTQNLSNIHSQNLTAIITGATSGIGAETARVLAKRGVKLILPVRNLKKAGEVRERILAENPEAQIILMQMDLSSFDSVRRFCKAFLDLKLALNILINNAGKYCSKLEFTEDKFEMTFATNYLGHFLLTETLLSWMVETADRTGIEGRIINVSSVIHNWVKMDSFRFSDMIKPKHYNGARAYAQSKMANILHAKEMAKRLMERKANVTINTVHPGIVETGIVRDHKGLITDLVFFFISRLLKSIPQGSSTICYAALSPDLGGCTGKYYEDCNEATNSNMANDMQAAAILWLNTYHLLFKALYIS